MATSRDGPPDLEGCVNILTKHHSKAASFVENSFLTARWVQQMILKDCVEDDPQ